MINRLAVILTGEYRAWPVCSAYTLEFFRNKARYVDYYFVTWNTTSMWHDGIYTAHSNKVTDRNITDYFFKYGGRLVDYKLVAPIAGDYTYYKRAYLSKIANKLKQDAEVANQFVYDQVVETRSDIYFRESDPAIAELEYSPWGMLCDDYEYQGGVVGPSPFNEGTLFINDTYTRMNSFTHDILSSRIDYHGAELAYQTPDPHHLLADYLATHNIQRIDHPQQDFYCTTVIRNQAIESDLNSLSIDSIILLNPRRSQFG